MEASKHQAFDALMIQSKFAMRTTITLDPDVAQSLKNVLRDRNVTFKEAVNDALRAGLKGTPAKRSRFRQRTFSLGTGRAFRWDNALEMAAAMEDEELVRKMALRK